MARHLGKRIYDFVQECSGKVSLSERTKEHVAQYLSDRIFNKKTNNNKMGASFSHDIEQVHR